MNLMDAAQAIILDQFPNTEVVEETVDLVGWGTFDDLKGSIPQRVFGELAKRAMSVVREYHSDLYHDAMWVKENVTGPCEFDYLVRPFGTNLGTTAKIMHEIEAGSTENVLYSCRVWCDDSHGYDGDGHWKMTFTVIG